MQYHNNIIIKYNQKQVWRLFFYCLSVSDYSFSQKKKNAVNIARGYEDVFALLFIVFFCIIPYHFPRYRFWKSKLDDVVKKL